ncbi:replication initiator protein A [Leuconostoc palmae]|uniref:replication initiator protein A n=1 Tax=Leuconostoc palmae TaxID=501487 RepID=UPI001FEA0D1C
MISDQDTPMKMERVSRNQVETNERFYKIPKALFENEFYADMKLETKMAYAILRDRFLLSIKNNWIDKNGDVYLIYKNSDLQTILSVGEKKVINLKKDMAAYRARTQSVNELKNRYKKASPDEKVKILDILYNAN